VRYVADANTPYSQVSADASAIDQIQYPGEVLRQLAGDCDDLTVLYCALLESAGISTALVDYPGHILLLFDTGVARDRAYQLPVAERLYVRRGDRLWVPVEITQIGQSFQEAWQLGAEELSKLPELARRERVVDTGEAWQQYPASTPELAGEVGTPDRAAVLGAFQEQYAVLSEMVDDHLEATYLDPLKLAPENDALRTRLLQVYVALQQYDAAIEAGLNHLIDKRGDKAATHNHLGIAYFRQHEMAQAAFHFQLAAELRPEDPGVSANLDRALRALGREETSEAGAGLEYAAADSVKAVQADIANAFHWIE
jgi:tetratricopeptide (TPR) repeat protein